MATGPNGYNPADCGHMSKDPMFPGAHDRDGRTMCMDCANAAKLRDFLACKPGDKFSGYLSGDGRDATTFGGAALGRVVSETRARNPFGGTIHYVRIIDANRRAWSGRGPGRGMYLRLKMNARQPNPYREAPEPLTRSEEAEEAAKRG